MCVCMWNLQQRMTTCWCICLGLANKIITFWGDCSRATSNFPLYITISSFSFYRFHMNMRCSFWLLCANTVPQNKIVFENNNNSSSSNAEMRLIDRKMIHTSGHSSREKENAFCLLLLCSLLSPIVMRTIGQIKNEEHTPQFHIWINLIQLFILSFFSATLLLFLVAFIYPAVFSLFCLFRCVLFCGWSSDLYTVANVCAWLVSIVE